MASTLRRGSMLWAQCCTCTDLRAAAVCKCLQRVVDFLEHRFGNKSTRPSQLGGCHCLFCSMESGGCPQKNFSSEGRSGTLGVPTIILFTADASTSKEDASLIGGFGGCDPAGNTASSVPVCQHCRERRRESTAGKLRVTATDKSCDMLRLMLHRLFSAGLPCVQRGPSSHDTTAPHVVMRARRMR